ncbi:MULTISPECIES: MerR family DNA-binding protein [unclassified Vibrio]|uniref:MerR family DNA-binding protein n=1 Tax=unclassified Vibrio TaxID=2614977 RepID=UPI001361282C|nr:MULTISPECIES: MerR family DNA-binding protein [unclassified Vibrio]NAW58965.1 MerR family DNA-binding protein [Vibrio sp. V36_P2S2PM302]NAX24849.1 MerR family DNA-binding protein [Vibrio sp. V38_P2S17PM301]NAX31917.1 MerR family DNA-binding protein [Vibrio sp. V37_P2S8PM304]
MTSPQFSIGQIADRAEKIGLMPDPPRTEGGHRMYALSHVKRLNFIRRSRELGFSIVQIKELLTFIDEPNHYCGEVKAVAMLQARAIQQKIDDLERLKQALNSMVSQCKGASISIDSCPIIDALYVDK